MKNEKLIGVMWLWVWFIVVFISYVSLLLSNVRIKWLIILTTIIVIWLGVRAIWNTAKYFYQNR